VLDSFFKKPHRVYRPSYPFALAAIFAAGEKVRMRGGASTDSLSRQRVRLDSELPAMVSAGLAHS
jgi:hypothetical protein